MKAVIVGLGSIGTRHARNLRGLGVEIAGCDPNAASRESFAKMLPGAKLHAALGAALDDGADFAVIASPSACHADQAKACLARGLDLFVEKPLAIDAASAGAIERAGDGHVCIVGSNWKFHPSVEVLRDAVHDRIGEPLAVQSIGGQYLPDRHPWEDYRAGYAARHALGGGALLDSHEIDYLSWLFGPIDSVSCRLVTTGTIDIETEDLAVMTIGFASGVLGTLQTDYLQRPVARRVHVTGTKGSAVWDVLEQRTAIYDAERGAWTVHVLPFNYDLNQMYVREIEHFLGAVKSRAATITPFAQGRHTLQVIDAARASAREGGRPVTIA
jgi:predicted dehydrogenase